MGISSINKNYTLENWLEKRMQKAGRPADKNFPSSLSSIKIFQSVEMRDA